MYDRLDKVDWIEPPARETRSAKAILNPCQHRKQDSPKNQNRQTFLEWAMLTKAKKEIFLLFKPEMILATLHGRKTQTRRIATSDECRFNAGDVIYGKESFWAFGGWVTQPDGRKRFEWDRTQRSLQYCASHPKKPDYQPYPADYDWYKRPCLFMPKWACRLRAEVIRGWQEPLQDISEQDAIAEGIQAHPAAIVGFGPWRNYTEVRSPISWFENPVASYMSLWMAINGEESWRANPIVDVAEFKVFYEGEGDG